MPGVPHGRPSDLRVGLVGLPALEAAAEQQGAQLAVLVLDVVLDGCLARPAQLVHLLQVVPVHLDLLVISALRRGTEAQGLQGATMRKSSPICTCFPRCPTGQMAGNKGRPEAGTQQGPQVTADTPANSVAPKDAP